MQSRTAEHQGETGHPNRGCHRAQPIQDQPARLRDLVDLQGLKNAGPKFRWQARRDHQVEQGLHGLLVGHPIRGQLAGGGDPLRHLKLVILDLGEQRASRLGGIFLELLTAPGGCQLDEDTAPLWGQPLGEPLQVLLETFIKMGGLLRRPPSCQAANDSLGDLPVRICKRRDKRSDRFNRAAASIMLGDDRAGFH